MVSLRSLALTLLVVGCASQPPARMATQQLQCAITLFPTNIHVDAWSVDKFAGRYLNGSHSLAVRRDEHRLLVEGWTLGTRELTADNVESWTWHDGCGATYSFVLPPDGPGAWLKITLPDGSTSDWHR